MTPEIKYRPESLIWDNYRGVLVTSSLELAMQADAIEKPNHLPPADITFFVDSKMHYHRLSLLVAMVHNYTHKKYAVCK